MIEFNEKTLEIFLSVVQTGHYSETAKQLFFTPQAVSQQMKNLEQSLDTVLFRRSGNQLELTEAGRIYAEAYQNYMTALNAAKSKIVQPPEDGVTHLRFVISERFSMHGKLKDAILKYRKKEPDARVTAIYGHVEEALHSGTADVAIVCMNNTSYSQELERVQIARIEEKLIVSGTAAHISEEKPYDPFCWGLPCIIQAPPHFSPLQREYSDRRRLDQYDLHPRTINQVTNMKTIIAMLRISPCVTISDTEYSLNSLTGVKVFDLPEPVLTPWLSCVWLKKRTSPQILRFVEILQKELGTREQ